MPLMPDWLPNPPTWMKRAVLIFIVLSWLPLVLIARARTTVSEKPRMHLIQDMDNQPKLKTQTVDRLFADDRAMRPRVPGTVSRGGLEEDDGYSRGRDGDKWLDKFPIAIRRDVVDHGRERFNIYCAPCHGRDGRGDGPINKRAQALQEPTWVPPTSLVSQQVMERAVGHLFNTITNGIRTMPAYGAQIPVEDRWAIVAYVRALQFSQRVSADDLPADEVDAIRE
jgi:mono/diheme cytochrome c family protein